MPVSAVNLPFREQSEFFRRKLNMNTESWTDVYAQEHDWSFMVAGANRDSLVADFRDAVDKVVADGRTLEQFRQDFDAIVARHGWSYKGGRNWRSRIIYETNLNQSYNAGRYEQLLAVRIDRPYWQYLHNDAVEHPRLQHKAWHGMVLRWDDPWWQHFFPANGWGCQCRVIALSEDDLRRMGKSGPDQAPEIVWEDRLIGQRGPNGPRSVRVPKGIDPGFEYVPGQSRLNNAMPPRGGSPGALLEPGATAPDPLPPPKPVPPIRLLPPQIPADDAVDAFLAEFDAEDEPVLFRDAAGDALVIGRDLFERDGELDVSDEESRILLLLADAIRDPDEIWTVLERDEGAKTATVKRRYLARFLVDGFDAPVLTLFEWARNAWRGLVATDAAQAAVIERRVRGSASAVRRYRRPER